MLSADFSKWGQLRKQTYAQKKEKDLRQQRVAARAKAGVLLSGRSDQPPTPELTEELRNNPLLRVEYCTALIVEGEKPLTDEFAVAPSDLAGLLREALFKTYCRSVAHVLDVDPDTPGLRNLPFDVIIAVASYLIPRDVRALRLASRTLYVAATTSHSLQPLSSTQKSTSGTPPAIAATNILKHLLATCSARDLTAFLRASLPSGLLTGITVVAYMTDVAVRSGRPQLAPAVQAWLDDSWAQPPPATLLEGLLKLLSLGNGAGGAGENSEFSDDDDDDDGDYAAALGLAEDPFFTPETARRTVDDLDGYAAQVLQRLLPDILRVLSGFPTYDERLDALVASVLPLLLARLCRMADTQAFVDALRLPNIAEIVQNTLPQLHADANGRLHPVLAAASHLGLCALQRSALHLLDSAVDLGTVDFNGKNVMCHWAAAATPQSDALDVLLPFVTGENLLGQPGGRSAAVQLLEKNRRELVSRLSKRAQSAEAAGGEGGNPLVPAPRDSARHCLDRLITHGAVDRAYYLYWCFVALHKTPGLAATVSDLFEVLLARGPCKNAPIRAEFLLPHLPLYPADIAARCTGESCMMYAEDSEFGNASCCVAAQMARFAERLSPIQALGSADDYDWEVLASRDP